MHIDRRRLLIGSGALAGAALAGLRPSFAVSRLADGTHVLRAVETMVTFGRANADPSPLWLYDGQVPGPALRARQGEPFRVRLVNELPVPTSIHWHGLRVPNAMDGVAALTQPPVPPGGTFEYAFVPPDAGTYWYHSHAPSWEQVARGLSGPLIVDEPEPPFDASHDITLFLDDWRVHPDGHYDFESLGFAGDWSHAGRLGNLVTVNGRPTRNHRLRSGEAYRLRIVNAANARIFRLNAADIGARIIALDGFALERPRPAPPDGLPLYPAQRVDLLLRPQGPGRLALHDMGEDQLALLQGDASAPLATFDVRAGEDEMASPAPILALPSVPEPDGRAALRVPLIMEGGASALQGEPVRFGPGYVDAQTLVAKRQFWAFNGTAGLSEEPLFRVERGRTVEIAIEDRTGWPHGIHVHGHHFRTGSGGLSSRPGDWRDTIALAGGDRATVAFVADNPGRWLIHCHMLEHAASGMNAWFEVV